VADVLYSPSPPLGDVFFRQTEFAAGVLICNGVVMLKKVRSALCSLLSLPSPLSLAPSAHTYKHGCCGWGAITRTQETEGLSGRSKISVNGALCDDYFAVRDLLYSQFHIL
jgi:hypothetical protein